MQEATPDTLNDLPGTRCYLAHKTAGGLVRSSEGGCTICSILWNELSDAQQKAVLAFSVQNSLTFLMLQPSSLIRTEGGWLLTAWIEDKAKAVEGEPDHEILVFFLQPKEGKPSSFFFTLIS